MLIDLPDNTKRLLAALVAQQPNQLHSLSLTTLCQNTGLARRTAIRHLKILRALKLVKVKRAARGFAYSYYVAPQCYTSLRSHERYRIS